MKTLLIGFPMTVFVWIIIFFVYSVDSDITKSVGDGYFIEEQLMFVENTGHLLRLNCALMQRRNDVACSQLELITKQFEGIEMDSCHLFIDSLNISEHAKSF